MKVNNLKYEIIKVSNWEYQIEISKDIFIVETLHFDTYQECTNYINDLIVSR